MAVKPRKSVRAGTLLPMTVRPAEAAAMLGVGLTTTYMLMNTGKLKAVKLGTARLITVSSIQALIADAG